MSAVRFITRIKAGLIFEYNNLKMKNMKKIEPIHKETNSEETYSFFNLPSLPALSSFHFEDPFSLLLTTEGLLLFNLEDKYLVLNPPNKEKEGLEFRGAFHQPITAFHILKEAETPQGPPSKSFSSSPCQYSIYILTKNHLSQVSLTVGVFAMDPDQTDFNKPLSFEEYYLQIKSKDLFRLGKNVGEGEMGLLPGAGVAVVDKGDSNYTLVDYRNNRVAKYSNPHNLLGSRLLEGPSSLVVIGYQDPPSSNKREYHLVSLGSSLSPMSHKTLSFPSERVMEWLTVVGSSLWMIFDNAQLLVVNIEASRSETHAERVMAKRCLESVPYQVSILTHRQTCLSLLGFNTRIEVCSPQGTTLCNIPTLPSFGAYAYMPIGNSPNLALLHLSQGESLLSIYSLDRVLAREKEKEGRLEGLLGREQGGREIRRQGLGESKGLPLLYGGVAVNTQAGAGVLVSKQ